MHAGGLALTRAARSRDRAAVRNASLSLLLCALLGGCLRVPPDLSEPDTKTNGAPTTAGEVLARHIKAIGGAPKLESIRQRTVEARMTYRAEPGCEADDGSCFKTDQVGSFVLNSTADGKLYRRTVLGDLVEERGYDGKTGWSLSGDGLLRVDTPSEAAVSREDALLHWYFGVAERGIETTLLQPRNEDSQKQVMVLDGVQWRVSPEQPAKSLWFDRKTGLLREESIEEGEDENRREQIISYDDYKDVDGVLVAFKVKVTNRFGDREQVVDFETQRVIHDAIDGKKFEIPKLAAPKPVPDPLVGAIEQARKDAAAAPKDPSMQVALARLLFADGRFEAAAEAASATLAIDGKEPEALFILARSQLLRGDLAGGQRTLQRAAKAGVKPEAIARQLAWVFVRQREFGKLARALDDAGSASTAGRYRAFVGKPFAAKMPAGCVASEKLVTAKPLAIADVTIGGKHAGAIVDTGSAEVVIGESLAKEAGLAIRPSDAPPDSPEQGWTELPAMTIAGVEIANVPATVISDDVIAEMSGEPAGKVRVVVGTRALSEFLITIDVAGGKLELIAPGSKCKSARDARRTGKAVPFYLHEAHHLYIRAKLLDAEGMYLLNTGMRGADLAANQGAYAIAGIGAPPLRSDEIPLVDIARVTLGDLVLDHVMGVFGYFEQTQSADGFRIDGVVGLGTIGRKAVSIDYETQKIWITP